MAVTAKQKITAKLTCATMLMWVCILAAGVPLLYAIYELVASTRTAEGGFLGMAVVFTLFTWGIILLFPLYGFAEALRWRRNLQDQLRKLDSEDKNAVC